MSTQPPRVVVLFGPSIHNKNTLATLIEKKINVVGAVQANQHEGGVNKKFIKTAIKKQGVFKVGLQVIERIIYKIINNKKDQQIHKKLFNTSQIEATIQQWKGNIHETTNYDDDDCLGFIRSLKPDVIVIHTPYWVGKKVRDIVDGKVIGGHPGITQYYRGAHSPFWAIYRNDAKNIGYTVFWVDKGVDTGAIIQQGYITPEKGDSYITLSWKGMQGIAEDIAKTLNTHPQIENIPATPYKNLGEPSLFYHPTIFQYLKYRTMQNKVR